MKFVGLPQLSAPLASASDLILAFTRVFSIPADSDDTSCNLALGGKLASLKAKGLLTQASDAWESSNNDEGKTFDMLKKYAYRPFSTDEDASKIDPRTYFWLHDFLTEIKGKKGFQAESIVLVTTWLQSASEIPGSINAGSSKMPFNVNNIDATVAANALFGITEMVLHGPSAYREKFVNDRVLQDMYLSTATLLEWVLRTNQLSIRPDLVLLYYPPIYDYYWFVARLSKLLKSRKDLPAVFEQVRDLLQSALKTHATTQLFSRSQQTSEHAYFDDFLGNADKVLGKPAPKYEDRVFSTSVAVKALMDIWDGEHNIPEEVTEIVKKSLSFLATDAERYPTSNAFFSASVKSGNDIPFYYPANRITSLDGKLVSCNDTISFTSFGITAVVQGYMPEFSTKVDQLCFGKAVPKIDEGRNAGIFPYWSSDALTRVLWAGALVRGYTGGWI